MSDTSSIARLPQPAVPQRDNNADAANQARQRIAQLPNTYLAHAAPAKEDLVGAVQPVSPAAEVADADNGKLRAAADRIAATATAAKGIRTAPSSDTITADGPSQAEPAQRRGRRRLPSQLMPLIVGVSTFVVLALLFKAPIFLSQLSYLTHPKSGVAATQADATTTVSPDPVISIPKINVKAPVVFASDNSEGAIETDLQSGVVHYANTALPGQIGNSVIFGHSSNDWWQPGNYKFVFVLLDKLQAGDTFSVNYNSHQYIYKVTGSTIVLPTDVSVLDQTTDSEMTLITCTPPGTSWKRLVVTAKQISPATAPATAAPATTTGQKPTTLADNSPSLTQQISSFWQGIVRVFEGKKAPDAVTTGTGTTAQPTSLPATQ